MSWTTRFPDKYTQRHGCDELHGVFYQPVSDPGGKSNVVLVSIPETKGKALDQTMLHVTASNSRVLAVCDTAIQAEEFATYAASRLPSHVRISMERAEMGLWTIFNQS